MGKTIFEKIIKAHNVSGDSTPGMEIGIIIDQTLTQDATGTMAYLAFEQLNLSKIKTEVSVSYVDHNTLQESFENADDHKYLETIAMRYGLRFSKAGNGICHQVHLERFARPGKTLLGSDSHTCTGGAMGMLAIGAGGLDIALALAGEPFYITYPRIVKINLTGKLRHWVSAKDVILEILRIKTTKGNVNTVLEYGGNGVKTLSVPERATIANMGAELGVTASIFPSDEVTKTFLKAQHRGDQWKPLLADSDARYDEVVNINLTELEPLIACPHSPDNVKKVQSLANIRVDQVCIGSCTNSSYKDLMMVATAFSKKAIHPGVSVVVAPGSKQVFEMIARDRGLEKIISAGARIVESSCGFCIGLGQAPREHAVSVRTNNRNFHGRCGTKSAGVYLTSPETAIACAITGRITDPRTLGLSYTAVKQPEKFITNDNMILFKQKGSSNQKIYRGNNIKTPPPLSTPQKKLLAPVLIKLGDKITTDHIMPAGARLKYRSNVYRYADFVFEHVDAAFAERARKEKKGIIVAGKSYGQGSSREHAALCPAFLGVKAVVAQSIERIHRANLINYGILPLTFVNEKDYAGIKQGDLIEIEDVTNILKAIKSTGKPGTFVIVNKRTKKHILVEMAISSREAEIVLVGGSLNFVKKKLKKK